MSTKERIQTWIAWKLPKWLVKWAFIRLAAYATGTEKHKNTIMGELKVVDALECWK